MTITETRPSPTAPYSPPTAPERDITRILGYVCVAVLGLAVGSAASGTPDPEVVERIVTVDPIADTVAALDIREQTLDARQAELDARAATLQGETAALNARDAAVSTKEATNNAGTFGDGVYEVGVDVQPGTYATDGAGGVFCYVDTKSADGGIVDQDVSEGGHVVFVISPAAKTFKSTGCGTWTKR